MSLILVLTALNLPLLLRTNVFNVWKKAMLLQLRASVKKFVGMDISSPLPTNAMMGIKRTEMDVLINARYNLASFVLARMLRPLRCVTQYRIYESCSHLSTTISNYSFTSHILSI